MLNLITRRTARAARVLADAVRSVVAPAALVRDHAPATAVPDPADVLTPEEAAAMAEEIETAGTAYADAADLARAGDRGKRKARRLLDRVPAGRYGAVLIERVQSSRQTPDLEAIRATYARLDLGDVPMRSCAASLRVTVAEELAAPAPAAAPVLVAA
ncbi:MULTISPECIES: hypothetical protein [unclassified Streptomyces]|uniref:hypothetical protein n=1 Tax=unclassified Streptomyces TaxID=2593676 RepID=UPI000DACCCDF|nr:MULTISPECIES: hypothetical protein [unclassified Streptomyces]PZT74504.1 hypothetical protein DNK55_20615 [Streptomyces sp. AC1-42T]PZT82510.1 hypothetical protein DNK56_10830 [Streptomyces sp. AC1-42W]